MSKATRRDASDIDDICAGLFSRGDGMTYHWTILVPKSPTRAHKLHANDFVPGTWTYVSEEQTMTRVVGEIPPPIAVVKLGSLNETCTPFDSLERICSGLPVGVPPRDEEWFNCRTWFKAAMEELDDLGIVTCSDVRLLENELTHLAMLEEASQRPTPAHFISGYSK